jgi:general L-amino acid transport system permease protein
MRRHVILYQCLLVALVAAICYGIFSTTQANLARLGVESNFDFLFRRAGFEIGWSVVPFHADDSIARAFLVALVNTLLLTASAIAAASALGLALGLARLSGNWLLSRLASVYVEIFRNVPALLQIFFWYFVVLRTLPRSAQSIVWLDGIVLNNRGLFLPAPADGGVWILFAGLLPALAITALLARWSARRRQRTGHGLPAGRIGLALCVTLPLAAALAGGVHWDLPRPARFGYAGGLVLIPEFLALVCGLSMYNATYIGEIVRSAFAALPPGQREAGESLGLSRGLVIRLVLLPQALRIMIPPLATVYLNLFKSTSLAAAIAYPEVASVFVGTVNNLVGQPVAIMALTLAVYAAVSLVIALVLHVYRRRLALGGG